MLVKQEDSPDLETMRRADIPAIWSDYRAQLEKLKATAETLTVTDVSQKAEMKLARVTRLTLKDLRVAIEKRRKELGEDYLRKTQKINAAAKELKELIEPLETRLLEQEQFSEIQEAKRKSELKATREAELIPTGADVSLYRLDEMPDETYARLLADSITAKANREEAARKAEAERIAKEKAEAEERERIRQENEALRKKAAEMEAAALVERKRVDAERKAAEEKARKEREEIERKAAAERQKAEAAALAEKLAREKVETELRQRKEAEAAASKAKAEAERKAQKAPDKTKLTTFADTVRALRVPDMVTQEGAQAAFEVSEKVAAFAEWIDKKATAL